MEHSAVLMTCIKLPHAFKILACPFLSGCLRQVSLYVDFRLEIDCLLQVTIPALATTAPPFQPTKLCRTVDEAKTLAAEFVLQQLGIPLDGEGCSISIDLLNSMLKYKTAFPLSQIPVIRCASVASLLFYIVYAIINCVSS